MGKLTQQQREVVGSCCVAASVKNNNKKQVVVYTTDKNSGLSVKGVLASAYPSYKFYKAENRAANTTGQVLLGIFTLGAGNAVQAASQTWKNFTVETGSNTDAVNLVQEINDCIMDYGNAAGIGGGGSYDPTQQSYSGDDEPEKKSTDWTTYIIIGAAVAVIILLLWDRKKK